MAKPEIESGEVLTFSQLHNEVLDQLLHADISDAEISARRIVEEATGIEPHLFNVEQEQLVTEGAVIRADAMPVRRARGEPLQYVGEPLFLDRKLKLSPDLL